jgi:prevent-host-death family protein
MLNRISASDLHQRVGEILAEIRYGKTRFVVERRGVPVAAVVSIEDLEQLETLEGMTSSLRSVPERLAALERAAAARRLILHQRRGKLLPSSAETIRQMREERTHNA